MPYFSLQLSLFLSSISSFWNNFEEKSNAIINWNYWHLFKFKHVVRSVVYSDTFSRASDMEATHHAYKGLINEFGHIISCTQLIESIQPKLKQSYDWHLLIEIAND